MVYKKTNAKFIAVMGVTGAGKSNFIRLACGDENIEVGHDLNSCKLFVQPPYQHWLRFAGTAEVAPYRFKHGQHEIVLVDTPGFNDTKRSETEVLKDIADWLEATYREPSRIQLSGIIYLQSIGHTRMFGSTMRNLKMFRQLCGDQPMKNVVLATTFWDKEDLWRAEEREEQLRTDPAFWQPMIKKGAHLERVTDRESALDIIMTLVNKEPVTLAIQDELINQHLDLSDTSAGKTVNEELEKLAKVHKAELAKIRDEMREAIAERDTELQEALAASSEAHEREMLRIQRDQDSLRYERRSENRRHQQDMAEMNALVASIQQRNQREREEDRRANDIRFRAQEVEKQMQFDAVVAQLRQNEHKVREEERVFLQQQIQNAQAEPPHKKGRTSKLLIALGEVIGSVGLTALGFPTILGNPFSGIMDLVEDIFE